MAVGKGSMARASRAAAKEKEPVKEVKAAAEDVAVPVAGKTTGKKAPGRKLAAKKKPAAKKETAVSGSVGIGQEMPVYYY